jgi:hypothetical protein
LIDLTAITRMPVLKHGLSPRGLQIVCGVLALATILAAAKLVAVLVAADGVPRVVFPQPPRQPQVAALNLYPRGDSGQIAGDNLSEAALDARLLGVVRGDSQAFATLVIKGNSKTVFRVGDSLAAGVSLEAIEPTRVVVRERGALRRISLATLLDQQPPLGLAPEPVAGVGGKGSPQALLLATPVLAEDGASALRIDQLGPDLESLGLVARGDLVVAVAGRPLAELMADGALLRELESRDTLTLTLVRDGSETTVDVDSAIIRSLLSGN